MKQIIIIICISSLLMSGFFNDAKIVEEKIQQAEAQRLCKIYTEKTKKYKESMRKDDLAQATLANYLRIEHKYCDKVHG